MSMTDPVADLLTRIRNGMAQRHETIDIPLSKLKLEMVRILKEEGYVADYQQAGGDKHGVISVTLRYGAGKIPVLSTLTRVSRPGCRVYVRKSEIPTILGGMGICILSTSQGIFTGKHAREKGLGGEVLCSLS